MKRKFLEDLGLEKETIDKVLDENSKDIGAAKGELETVKNELATTKQTLSDTNKQLEEIKKTAGDNAALQKQITDLQEANKQKDAEMVKVKRSNIDDLLLTEAKAKNLKAVKALLKDINEEDDEKYRAARLAEIEELAKADDSKFLFGGTKIKGAKPGETDSDPDKPDFSKMTYSEEMAYRAEHPEVE